MTSSSGSIRRRDLMAAGGAAALAAPLAGCDLLSSEPAGKSAKKQRGEAKSKEAPMLADQVKAGKLPPLAKRLPEKPAVVKPVERAGDYGGEWRSTMLGRDDGWVICTAEYDPPIRFDPPSATNVPNLLESFEANGEATRYTLRLRKGLRWSDGEPFTAEDLLFALNDVLGSRKLYPAQPSNPPTASKVDDYTVAVSFKSPNGIFLLHPDLSLPVVKLPAHYLKEFHADFNPDVEDLVKKAGTRDWTTLFQNKADPQVNVELPTITAYRPVALGGNAKRIVVERNPYYWKVDTEGRQLPYIDRITYEVVNDPEVILLKATSGEIDMQDRNLATLQNKPVLARNRDKGQYRFFDSIPDRMNKMGIAFNLTHKDPAVREVLANKNFRIGLSHAVNRQEIVDAVYQRQGRPWQMSPRPETSLHNERLATQYLEYDTDLANEFLDRAGYAERDSDGFRLRPDGKRITIQLAITREFGAGEWADVADLLKGYWDGVGVATNVDVQSSSLLIERWEANEFELIVWEGYGGSEYDTVLDPGWYLLQTAYGAPAPPWSEWYTSGGKEGAEPPEQVRRQLELYDQIVASFDQHKRNELMRQILDICADLFHSIGICLPARTYGVVKNDFRNVPDPLPAGWYNPGSSHPEQFFRSA